MGIGLSTGFVRVSRSVCRKDGGAWVVVCGTSIVYVATAKRDAEEFASELDAGIDIEYQARFRKWAEQSDDALQAAIREARAKART